MNEHLISPELFNIDTHIDRIFYRLNHQYPIRTFYRGLLPKSLRKKLEYNLDLKKQKRISLAWQILLNIYQQKNLNDFSFKPKKHLPKNNIIWQYWGQSTQYSDLPEVVQICFKSVEKYKGDYQIIRLNDDNIHEYLDLPEFITEKRKNSAFKYAFFADLLRLALLDTYGGIWIDATILMTAPISNELLEQEFFMFQRDPKSSNKKYYHLYDGYFNWHSKHKINCLNSFIIAKQGTPIIHNCLNGLLHFWKTQNNIPHYYFFQIMFDTIIKQGKYKNCQIIDDTIPHLLHNKIKQKFDNKEYEFIKNQTNIHKLTYTKKYSNDSYFAYLKKQFKA